MPQSQNMLVISSPETYCSAVGHLSTLLTVVLVCVSLCSPITNRESVDLGYNLWLIWSIFITEWTCLYM